MEVTQTQPQTTEKNCPMPKWLFLLLCVAPWALGILGIVWILMLRFPLTGVFTVESDATGQSAFVFPFLPGERTTSPGRQEDGWYGQRIIDDPVYMNVRTPGPYDSVSMSIDFRTMRQPLLEFGFVRDKEGKQLELYPMYSEMLESQDWQPAGGKGFVLTGLPSSRLDQRDTRGLAIWDGTSTAPLMSDVLSVSEQSIDVSLRGSHDFWVVPGDGQIDFRMEVQDVNRNRSGGMLVVRVVSEGRDIWQDTVGTSGSRDRGYGSVIPVKVSLKDLKPGVYRIKILADDDVFIRRIMTRNPRWVVGTRLVVGDTVGFPTTSTNALQVWTTARHIVAETFHKEGLQEVQFGPIAGQVRKTHTPVRIDRVDSDAAPVELTAPKGDIRLISDGFFSFARESFFEPEPRHMSVQTDGRKEGLQAVLTSYERVEDLGDGWKRATFDFPITHDAETLRFVLSAPGIASRAGSVDIRRVQVSFRREAVAFDTWWKQLLEEAKRAWRRL